MVLVAGCSAAAWLAVARTSRAKKRAVRAGVPEVDTGGVGAGDGDEESGWPGWTSAASIVRRSGALRWLLLLEVSDLLLDVLTAFLALYLVVAVHASPFMAALGVAVRLGAGLADSGSA